MKRRTPAWRAARRNRNCASTIVSGPPWTAETTVKTSWECCLFVLDDLSGLCEIRWDLGAAARPNQQAESGAPLQ